MDDWAFIACATTEEAFRNEGFASLVHRGTNYLYTSVNEDNPEELHIG